MMRKQLVIRAEDPAGLARFYEAVFGLDLSQPDRAQPDGWHGRLEVELSIVPAEEGERPSIHVGHDDPDKAAGVAAAVGGGTEPSGRTVFIVDPEGNRIPVRPSGPKPPSRPFSLTGTLYYSAPVLRLVKREVEEAMRRAGLSNPRLASEAMIGDLPGARHVLVLDGPADADLSEVERILAEHRKGRLVIRPMLAGDIPVERMATVDRLAYYPY